jgi:hypothetical protein
MSYNVHIVSNETGEVLRIIEVGPYKEALEVERGVNINLNHDLYHTEVPV